jgi:hypothetical protein
MQETVLSEFFMVVVFILFSYTWTLIYHPLVRLRTNANQLCSNRAASCVFPNNPEIADRKV